MTSEKTKRQRALMILLVSGGLLLLAGLLLLLLFQTHLFGSTNPRPLEGVEFTPPPSLSELAEAYPRLATLLDNPELGSVYKEFLVAYEEGGVEAALELARERGMLTPDGGSLRVTLVLDTEDHAPLVAQLENVNVEVVSAYRDRVNISVPVRLIGEALQSEETENVLQTLTELEHVIAVRMPEQRRVDQQGVIGEGVGTIGADTWHAAGYTGAGIRIGVLDLGFAGHEELLGRELPASAPLATFGWYDPEEVHGTACAEIIHEVAPDAELFFAWYDGADAAFGEAVEWLLSHDVQIISHSAGGVYSPRDGTGWDSSLVDDLSAQDVLWVNSAGNEADVHYRTRFNDSDGDGYHNFAPDQILLPIANWRYVEVYLLWDDDWNRPTRDYELLLLNAAGDILGSSQDLQNGQPGQHPVEWVAVESRDDFIYAAVQVYDDGGQPATFDLFAQGPGVALLEPVPQYSITSPGDAMGSLTVGAVEWHNETLAYYSSQGPTTDGRLKPEISAPTAVSGISYGNSGFDGTSASAPHVAGAAALVWQAHPQFTRQEVVDYLLAHTVDLGPAGADTGYGYGRLSLPPAPHAAFVPPPTPPTGEIPPVPVVTPGPASGGASNLDWALPLIGLLIGGFTLGGLGLLGLGGVLFVAGRRAARRPPYVPPSPRMPVAPRPSPPQARPSAPPPRPRPAPPALEPRCPSCQALIRPGARFCGRCGTSLVPQQAAPHCPHCGAEVQTTSRFCPTCGRPLSKELS